MLSKRIVLDWEKKNRAAMKKYINCIIKDGHQEIYYSDPNSVVSENILFRNFPNLHIETNQIVFSYFENCGTIYLTRDCGYARCFFTNIRKIICDVKFLKYCEFYDCECYEKAFVEMKRGDFESCVLTNIKLHGDTYLVSCSDEYRVADIKLENVTTTKQDCELYCGVVNDI